MKIKEGGDGYFEIDGVPYQKGAFTFEFDDLNQNLELKDRFGDSVFGVKSLRQFQKENGDNFADKEGFYSYIKPFFF